MIDHNEVQEIRNQTGGLARVVHFNNAGSSLPPDVVVNTVVDYLREEAMSGGYETEAKYLDQLNKVYEHIAKLINAESDEIAVFENASAAWCTALKGIEFQPEDEIIVCEMEYVTSLIGLSDLKKAGVLVKVILNDEDGNFPLAGLNAAITDKTRLIAVTHLSSSGGSMLPIEAIGEIAEAHQVLYLVDACQSAGQMPLDVKKIKCDLLSATGRKYLRAPRGTGFLYVKQSIQHQIKPLFLDAHAASSVSLSGYVLRPDARRFELYEKSRALTLGLGKAVAYALDIGLERIWNRISHLGSFARKELTKIPGVILHDRGEQRSGIITFTIEGLDSFLLKSKLTKSGINVSIGQSQATPIYMEKSALNAIVRLSLHYYNTEDEILFMCRELRSYL